MTTERQPLIWTGKDTAVILCVSANPSLDNLLVTTRLQWGRKICPHRWTVVPGGGAVRAAWIARELKADVAVTGFIAGRAGRMHTELLDAAGIHHNYLEVSGETRGKIFVMDDDSGLATEFAGPGPTLSASDALGLVARVREMCGPGDWVIISGSIPLSGPSDLYYHLTRAARAAGAKVALDSRGTPMMHGLKAVPDIWKPNAEEMQEAMALGVDPVDLCEQGTIILLSEGSNGLCLFVPGRKPCRYAPPRRKPWNPAGSGTALLAATVVALQEGKDIETAVAWGLAAGVANMRYDIPGFATQEDLEELTPLVLALDATD